MTTTTDDEPAGRPDPRETGNEQETRRVDPRIARTREVVLAAAVEELMDVGFERVSIDAIAERSQVARSTIYRNWEDRNALLGEAFRRVCEHGPSDLPPSKTVGEDLENLGRLLIASLQGEQWIRTVPSLISSATHDGEMGKLLKAFSAERAAETRSILQRAKERGTGLDEDDFASIMERFVAPFFMRRLVSQLPLDDELVESQVRAALAELDLPSGC